MFGSESWDVKSTAHLCSLASAVYLANSIYKVDISSSFIHFYSFFVLPIVQNCLQCGKDEPELKQGKENKSPNKKTLYYFATSNHTIKYYSERQRIVHVKKKAVFSLICANPDTIFLNAEGKRWFQLFLSLDKLIINSEHVHPTGRSSGIFSFTADITTAVTTNGPQTTTTRPNSI